MSDSERRGPSNRIFHDFPRQMAEVGLIVVEKMGNWREGLLVRARSARGRAIVAIATAVPAPKSELAKALTRGAEGFSGVAVVPGKNMNEIEMVFSPTESEDSTPPNQ